jgi:hypothetical protein
MKMQRPTETELQRSTILKDQNVRMTKEQTILEILSEKNDSDKNFLMTLLPALKRLSQRKIPMLESNYSKCYMTLNLQIQNHGHVQTVNTYLPIPPLRQHPFHP